MSSLSILIPSRNEEFLSRTVQCLLDNIEGDTEILVGLDGEWANPPLEQDKRVRILYYPESLGQRAITNRLCMLSKSKYVMKIDAHCTVDKGFDVKMMKLMQDDITMVPIMYNLYGWDWVCKPCDERQYQGPSHKYKKCPKCGKDREREIIWKPRFNRKSTAYRFDTTLHFQYWGAYKKEQAKQGDLADTFSLQGSCWMLTREKYWELNICDEEHGGWGQQGTEVATKTWLSGGRVVTNMTTWYAHMFRTQGGDFGFPYPLSGREVSKARKHSRALFIENTWDKAIYPLSWLIEKFKPIPDWHDKEGKEMLDYINKKGKEFKTKPTKKGIIFYTDNQLNLKIARRVQGHLKSIGLPIVSSSLKKMHDMGKNIHLELERGYLTMFKQILSALEASTAEIVFFCEHDVLYHPSHFDFTPEDKNTFYYNINVVKADVKTGNTIKVDVCEQVSGICVYRETAIKHYRERIAYTEKHGFQRNMGFEPGTHARVKWEHKVEGGRWKSKYPNIDIRHDNNLTPNRTSIKQFRNKRHAKGWTEKHISEIEGWDIQKLP